MPIVIPETRRDYNRNLVIKYHKGEAYPWAVHGEDGREVARVGDIESAIYIAPRAAIDAAGLATWQTLLARKLSGRRTI